MINLTVKAGNLATPEELREFHDLVLLDDQVDPLGLPAKIAKAISLSLVQHGDRMVSVGAIKNNPGHHAHVAHDAGFALPTEEYFGEVGYLHTAEAFRRKGYGSAVMESLLQVANGRGLFATVRGENDKSQGLLEKHGFTRQGTPWKSTRTKDDVHLFVLPPQNAR